jgi:hypothetical protein
MASRNKTRGNSALDSMMAGFAAGAAAFIIYAMPQARFDDAVALSGLPMVLSAAQPPLGMTARFAVMAAAGIGSFVLVWLVLRALGKPAPKPKRRSGPVAIEIAPPVLRRADAHPDAPSRRPILAGVDLGRPFDDLPVGEQETWDGLPEEEEQPGDDLDTTEESFSAADTGFDDLETAETVSPEAAPAYDFPSFEEEPEQADEWLPAQEVAFDGPSQPEEEQELAEVRPIPSFLVPQEQEEEAEQAEAYQNDAPLDLTLGDVQSVGALSQRLPEEEEEFPPIPQLMERLESGLVRRQPNLGSTPAPHPASGIAYAPAESPPRLDARLRGAITELQKLAGRGK